MAASTTIAAGLLFTSGTVPVEAANTFSAPLRTAVKALPVAAENNTSYDRDQAVRGLERRRPRLPEHPGRGAPERIQGQDQHHHQALHRQGRTLGYPLGLGRARPSQHRADRPHRPRPRNLWLWARNWPEAKRVAFYNDPGDHRMLSAQTSILNSAKQTRDPEAWTPPKHRCSYVGEWVAVKRRWGLKTDSAEKTALTRLATSCPNVTIKVTKI